MEDLEGGNTVFSGIRFILFCILFLALDWGNSRPISDEAIIWIDLKRSS